MSQFSPVAFFDRFQSIPVCTAISFRNIAHIFAQFLCNLSCSQPPAPIAVHGAGSIHPRGVVQAQPVLHRNDTGIGAAAHCQIDQLLVHPFVCDFLITDIVADVFLGFLVQAVEPAADGFVIMGTGIYF